MNISYFINKDELFPILKSNKFGIELTEFINEDRLINYRDYIDDTKDELKEIDEIALHGPFINLSVCSSTLEIRELTKLQYNYIYEIAKELGGKHIIVHLGYNPEKDEIRGSLENAIWFWQQFLFGKDDINFYVENVMEEDCNLLLELCDRVNRSNFKICLDIGHVNKNSYYSVENWIQQLNNRIGYVHLHNNNGKEDEHKGIINGTADIKQILDNLLVYASDAIWSLETSEVIESLEWLYENNYILPDIN